MQPISRYLMKRAFAGLCIALFVAGILPGGAGAAQSGQEGSVTPPEPAAGREIYLQNCAPCHGETGKGDGPSAQGLSVAPAALGDYATMADLPLTDWFDVTKNGRMDRMMPPWGQRLTDQQIWDTIGYAWTLHTSEAQVRMGKAVYDANCASCHGPDGKGSPDQVGDPKPDFTDFAATSAIPQSRWAQSVSEGKNGMPAFGDTLSQAERDSALEYVRSLSLGPMFAGPSLAGTGVISGTVTNGTTGAPAPGLTVEMAVFDGASLVDQRATTTDAAGLYRFEGLPTGPNLAFATRAEYPAGVTNGTDFATFQPDQTGMDLPLTVYETTTDGSGVRADRVHYIVDFQNGRALVAELLVFGLDGNRTYIGDGNGVLRFSLPPGAEELNINDDALDGRYQAVENGFVDTLPLPPGSGTRQVLYRYSLPYSGGKLDLERSLAYPANNVNALIADQGQKVASEGLENQGIRQTQTGNYYNLVGQDVPANQPVMIRLSGLPSAAAAATAAQSSTSRILLYALAAVSIAGAVLLALWPVLRRRAQAGATAEEAADREGLIGALAALDVAHSNGQISDAAYRERRIRLKAQLLDLVRKEEGP